MTPTILAPPRIVDARALVRPFARAVAAALAFVLVIRLAVKSTLPTALVAVVAPVVLVALACATFGVVRALGASDPRPLRRRHGLAVIGAGAFVSLPMLGAFTLVDPWETHYAEVAREMIVRSDFVSPWWAHEGWFMSKPVLTFWLEAISMKIFGVQTGPDQVLAGGAHPEWAVRMPAFALALLGSYVLYNGVSRTCGRRAGLFGALALWTMPGFALLSHQALTDMPLVACTGAALGFLLRALATPDAAHVDRFSIRIGKRAIVVHAGHALAIAILLFAMPQLLLLALEHVRVSGAGIHFARDAFSAGSPHACGLPGQPACAAMKYAHPGIQPGVIAMLITPLVLFVVSRILDETRASRLFALAAWTSAALATMAKGPAGLVVPAGAVLVVVAQQRSLRSLLRIEILAGLAIAIVMVAPWYLAVYARHGRVFLDELVMRHMLGRTLDHLHDTNDGEDVGLAYFVKQLGYATFPWCGLLAAASLSVPKDEDRSRRTLARVVFFGASLVAFALVSAMRTKFHHYVLLALPPCAMVVGIWLDERIAEVGSKRGSARIATTGALAIGAACVVALVARDLAGTPAHLVRLLTYRYNRVWPDTASFGWAIAVFGALAVAATLAIASRARRARAAIALGACSVAFATFVLDAYLVRAAPDGGQRDVIAAFYRARETHPTPVPLVAYQLNWKGENFYTGNRLAIFVSSGPPMRTWLDARRSAGEHTVYFVTEQGRVSGLRSELGKIRSFEKLTDEHVSAEFCLVRAEIDG